MNEAAAFERTAASTRSSFVPICRVEDIPRLGARVIRRPEDRGGNVALFRTADNRVFALRDRCPHKGGPLSQGIVFGDRVACPLHNWTIELASGCAIAPDQGCAHTFAVHVDGGVVHVALDDMR
ncbi:MAG TPA: nitrite reductase small subunit NirD [Casimicrobiaceae bacterium]